MIRQALVASAVRKLLIKSAADAARSNQEVPLQAAALNRGAVGTGIGAVGREPITGVRNLVGNYFRSFPLNAEKEMYEGVSQLPGSLSSKARGILDRIRQVAAMRNKRQMEQEIQNILRELKSDPELTKALWGIRSGTWNGLMNIETVDRLR